MRPPIFKGLYKYSKTRRIPFNSPGHKGKVTMHTKTLSSLDLFGASKDGDALNLRELIAGSEDEISTMYKACRSMYLLNGSTGGIYAMIGAYTAPGDKIIVDRNCHRAVINALIVQGLEPVYFKRPFNYPYSISGGIDIDELERAIISNRDAKAVIITSPTYFGVVSDVKKIADMVHKYNMKLLVDEALGAHFGFCGKLPVPSVLLGADLSVQSVHKTLGSFGGGALLHIGDKDIDFQRISDLVRMFESSNMSPALLCTLENAVYYAFENKERFDELISEIEKCRKIISENTSIRWIGNELAGVDSVFEIDPTRIVINFSHAQMSGYEAADFLRKKAHIEVESASGDNVVCLASIYNSTKEIHGLFHALAALSKKISGKKVVINNVNYEQGANSDEYRLSPQRAFNSTGEFVSPEHAVGRINKRIIYSMPDEVPIIVPGEKIKDIHMITISRILSGNGTVKGISASNEIEVVELADSFGL